MAMGLSLVAHKRSKAATGGCICGTAGSRDPVSLALGLAGAGDYLPATTAIVLFVLGCLLLWGLFPVTRRGLPQRIGRLSLYLGAAAWFAPGLWVGLVLTLRCWTLF